MDTCLLRPIARLATGRWLAIRWQAPLARHGFADILQGFLSLSSDVVLVDVPSVLHLADRVLAVLLTAIGIYVEVCVLLFAQLQVSHQLLMLALLVGGLAHHFRAKAAIRKRAH